MISEVLGTPLQLYFHGSVYAPSSWAGHLSEVKTCNGRLQHLSLGFPLEIPSELGIRLGSVLM